MAHLDSKMSAFITYCALCHDLHLLEYINLSVCNTSILTEVIVECKH